MDELEALEQEARRLLNDPAPHIERLRAINAQRTKLTLQEYDMSDDFFNTLNDDEAAELKAGIEATKARILQKRDQAKAAPLMAEYKAAMKAARGQGHKLTRIRDEYKRRGVPVHEIDFTGE